ncbi:MAG: alpha/beta fold hydrolase [Steroidobacteraceae bacterium]
MSAEAGLMRSPMPADRSARAIYFNSGEHRLFAWLHPSLNGLGPDIGVVICSPFGYEAICAHRGIRAFAEAIAAAGMPAIRFDYLGTGDSAEIDPDGDQVQIWTRDVLAAADELRRWSGVRQVCLLGFRFGALLATLAACESDSIGALIAISPIVTGRRYLRELRTTRMAASLGLDPAEPPMDKQGARTGGMEVSGFAFSAATLETLAKVDLSTPKSRLPQMLIVDSATMPATDGRGASNEAHERTTRMALPGLVEMLMTPPQFASAPKEIISATVEWLSHRGGHLASIPDRTADRRAGAYDSASPTQELTLVADASAPQFIRTERPVFFGSDALLFGIVTRPPPEEIRRRAVILLNAGADHHIGASRVYVSMARRWAQHGYVVLRMDLAGLGDSGTRPGRAEDDVFPQEALGDIRAAIEFLRTTYGVRDVTLAGLCSGAYHALRAAVAGLPVNRILMINPQNYFWKPDESLKDLQLAEVVHNPGVYRERIFSVHAWKRMFTGRVNVLRIVKIYLQRPLLTAQSALRDIARHLHIRLPNDLGTELEALIARGVRVVFVFARGEPGIGLLKLQAGSSVKRLAERCRIHTISSGDHVFTQSGPRAAMEKIVSDELFARPEWLDQPSANLKTGAPKCE